MKVVIDGVEYAPTGGAASPPGIGIAIKTHNRPDTLKKSLEKHLQHLPPNARLFVVDDGSKVPVSVPEGVELHRHEKALGIARASNRCLELLMAAGCDHLFIFDDDAWPIDDNWWEPYVEGHEPHAMAIFDKPDGAVKSQVEVLYEDETYKAYHSTRGYMLYVERRVVETVGGMDPRFGKWGWEHMSWSDRIHSAGFTTARYMDVKGSERLIYSMDQHNEIRSTATDEARKFSQGPGMEVRMESRNSPEYIEYRELQDTVLTCLLTDKPDPQRGKTLQTDTSLVRALHTSLQHEGGFVLFHSRDMNGDDLEKAEMEKVLPSEINVYFYRWLLYYQYLRDHPEIGRVWCVDATDVQMTRNPFPEMEPGVLYFGYEPTTLRDEWMLSHHQDLTLQKFMKENPTLPLLNMGVVGGDRETVMSFAQKVVKFYFDDTIDWIMGWEHGRAHDKVSGDMAAGNYVARTEFADRVSSGPHVTNVFKSGKKSPVAWWAHK